MTTQEHHDTPKPDTQDPVDLLIEQALADDPALHDAQPDLLLQALRKLAQQRQELDTAYRRALADLANFQRRIPAREQEVRQAATKRVLAGVIPVIDHLDRALELDPDASSASQVLDGLRAIRDEFLRVLASLNVEPIAPQPGDEFHPGHHQAIMQTDAPDIQPGRVASLMQPGYTLNDWVLRPAKVALAAHPQTDDQPPKDDDQED